MAVQDSMYGALHQRTTDKRDSLLGPTFVLALIVTIPHIPHFIGNDYFCETGTETFPSGGEFYSDDPLRDGEGCGPTSTCCELGNPPWFCKLLPAPTSDDIEVKICCLDSIDGANIAIEQIEMYIL